MESIGFILVTPVPIGVIWGILRLAYRTNNTTSHRVPRQFLLDAEDEALENRN